MISFVDRKSLYGCPGALVVTFGSLG